MQVQPEHHDMVLAHTYPSGEEEWYCPTCGRRFLMTWPPAYKRTILEPGDQNAYHSASKGEGFHLGAVQTTKVAKDSNDLTSTKTSISVDDDPTDSQLGVWHDWLEQADWGDF